MIEKNSNDDRKKIMIRKKIVKMIEKINDDRKKIVMMIKNSNDDRKKQ